MRILNILESVRDEEYLSKLVQSGYDVEELLYHGTNAEFDKFDRSFSRTAAHIYTTPDPNTASNYGKNVYEVAPRIKKLADLIDDHELLERLSDEIKEDFVSDLKYQYKTHDAIYADKNLLDRIPSLLTRKDDVYSAVERIKHNILKDPDIDPSDIEYELDFSDEYEELLNSLKLEIAKSYAYDLLQSSKVYEYDNGRLQDRLMDICYGWGYNCVRFYDYSSFGESESIVFEDASDLVILGLYEG